MHIIGQIIPITFYFYMVDMFLATLIPTAGREYDAGDNNPEFMIGILTGVFALLISQFFVRMSKTITYKFHSTSFIFTGSNIIIVQIRKLLHCGFTTILLCVHNNFVHSLIIPL